MKLKVKQLCETSTIPKYAHPGEDACMDLTIVIDNDKFRPMIWVPRTGEYRELEPAFHSGKHHFSIRQGESIVFHTGLAFEIEPGYAMKIYTRSSTGIKKGLVLSNGTAIIDAGYRNEVLVAFRNVSAETITVSSGERLVQAEIAAVVPVEIVTTDSLSDSKRGLGGIGSSGN